MKVLLYALIGLISFAACLALVLAATGNLNQETLSRLMGGEAALPAGTEAEPVTPADELGSLADRLKQKEAELLAREDALDQREAQINERETNLQQLIAQMETLKADIDTTIENREKERTVRLEAIAVRMGAMKADKASQVLKELADENPEDAARVFNLIQTEEAAKILDALDPSDATRILRELKRLDS